MSVTGIVSATRISPPSAIVQMNDMFKTIAKKVMPTIVFIKTTRLAEGPANVPPAFRHFFRRFGAPNQPRRRVQGVGSGVIINKKGYVVTNYHVIKGATGLTVTLFNNQEYKVDVVGSDEETDIAVLKMIGDLSKIKSAALGDSDKVSNGEIVFALGNPFGLRGSITQGIVSATSRNAEQSGGYDFIQTDAAINPGNSGGALVNIYGEVIGINRMIYTRTGGYMGIGFAIPINRIKDVITQILKTGKVTRGYLGVIPANPNDEASRRMNILNGVRIAEVMPGSPAEKAGLKPWDIIIKVNGKNIKNFRMLRRIIALTPPGKAVRITVKRKTKIITVKVKLANKEQAIANGGWGTENNASGALKTINIYGMVLRNLKPQERNEHSVTHGVVVVSVKQNTPAFNAGVLPGDIILEIESLRMSSISRAKSIISGIRDRNTFQMRIKRNGQIRFMVIER
jgi:serine protease Do